VSKRNPLLYLSDILQSIEYIETFLDNVSEDQFYSNVEKQDAVLRRLEIIGEAVRHLPDSIKDSKPEIPWRQISGMRNVIIHEYFGVTLGMIWLVATDDLKTLKYAVLELIDQVKSE
jgi:uncharacterized protein with HEPN domain